MARDREEVNRRARERDKQRRDAIKADQERAAAANKAHADQIAENLRREQEARDRRGN